MNASSTQNRLASVDLEYLFSYWATLAPPEVIGPIAEGIRVNFYVTAGEVSGRKMRGRLRTVGGDWLLLRPDGVGLLDVRATMELDDGALIFTTYGGVVDLGPEGYNLFLKGICRRTRTCESFQGITRAIRNICGSTACNVSVLACLMSRSRG
jgi:hypothetical protein